MATHSGDVIRGAIEQSLPNLKILRIQREGNINRVNMLDQDEIKKFWNDPILRYSNILDGLFHEKVVACEADSDCLFYSAVINKIYEEKNELVPKDLIFVNCGGKGKFPSIIKTFKKLSVPINIVADMDILRDEADMRNICEAFDLNWKDFKVKWEKIKPKIEKKSPHVPAIDFKKDIQRILSSVTQDNFPPKEADKISEICKKLHDPWKSVKKLGTNIFSDDQSLKGEFIKFINDLARRGIHIVPTGELEGFLKDENGKGRKWVEKALRAENWDKLEEAKIFCRNLVN